MEANMKAQRDALDNLSGSLRKLSRKFQQGQLFNTGDSVVLPQVLRAQAATPGYPALRHT